MHVYVDDKAVLVACTFDEKEMVKAIGGYTYLKKRNLWRFSLSSLIKIVETLNITYDKYTQTIYDDLKEKDNKLKDTINTVNQIKKGQVDMKELPGMKGLFDHQKKAVVIASMFDSYALFMEMGTGKTLSAIRMILYKMVPTMIVAPLSILESVWMNEIDKWQQVFNKSAKLKVVNLWNNLKEFNGNYNIYVINYEQFKKLKDVQAKIKFLIIDESSKLKNHTSGISKAILEYRDKIKYRLILSGKPAPNNLLEYWAQMSFINSELLDSNYYAFRNKYFYSTGYGGYIYTPFAEAREKIMFQISKQAFFIKKEECLDLPDKTFNIRTIIMDEIQRKKYNEMKNDNIMEFKSHTTLGANELAKIMKLRQITAGFTITTDGMPLQLSGSKIEELLNVLDEIEESRQVIIWVQFHFEIEMIKEVLKENYVTLYGDMKQKEKEEAINQFKARGVKYLIAHPASGGMGLNFTNCSYMIWFSLSYSLEQYAQACDRIHRIGQMNKCTYIHLLAKDSIDEVIYKALLKKQRISEACLAMLRGEK
jgi:SNF2 family DNA or RNA helicase